MEPSSTDITAILSTAYGQPPLTLTRLPVGQVTVNYRAEGGTRTLFVKAYLPGSDLDAEESAIRQARTAGEHGVPVAAVIPAGNGDLITRTETAAVSVWEWVTGRTVQDGLNARQQQAAGRALGRIHQAFAAHEASGNPAPKLQRWLHPDLGKLATTIDTLLARIAEQAMPDDFDRLAGQTLTERRTMLQHVPDLISGLPGLTTQVLHGDYSAVNLLFDGDELTAVTDFLPPVPFVVAYELGRIAFDPRTVLTDDWITSGTRLVAAYLRENPALPPQDVEACARAALLQLVTSLYGVKDHYLKPGLLQEDLDLFWAQRHSAAQRLMTHLDEVEDALAKTYAAHSH